jgi:uncharacterized UPF0160 family protein
MILATHSGKFHCDEVFAYAVLRLALGLTAPGTDHTLLRTRNPKLIESADVVWDVGTVYDPAANRFDHHQRGAPVRADETPYSSAGLVWQTYGERAVAALLRPTGTESFAAAIAADLDTSLVRPIDENDNGVSAKRESNGLPSIIGDFNPTWDHPSANGPTAGDEAFLAATDFAQSFLARRVDSLRARYVAEATVLAAHAAAQDPRLLVLETGMPWKNVIFTHDLPVLFTVSPASNGNWMIDTVPPEPGSFDQRLSLPESWAGLQAEELAAESGTADAVFVHVRRFVGAAKSQAGAVEMAQKALALG